MKWLYATLGLLSISFCLSGWIFLRDRDTSNWRPPEAQLARVDAIGVLNMLGGECPLGCETKLLRLSRTEPKALADARHR